MSSSHAAASSAVSSHHHESVVEESKASASAHKVVEHLQASFTSSANNGKASAVAEALHASFSSQGQASGPAVLVGSKSDVQSDSDMTSYDETISDTDDPHHPYHNQQQQQNNDAIVPFTGMAAQDQSLLANAPSNATGGAEGTVGSIPPPPPPPPPPGHPLDQSQPPPQQPSSAVPPPPPSLGAINMAYLDKIPKLLIHDMQSHESGAVDAAVRRLLKLCNEPDNRTLALQSGAPTILVAVMRRWHTNEKVLARCCGCIQNMLIGNPAVQKAFFVVGGVETVVMAMKSFPLSPLVQSYAIGALRNLFFFKNDTIQPYAKRFVQDREGLLLVVRVMKQFPKQEFLQEHGCGLVNNLVQFEELKPMIMRSGALTAIGIALEYHSENVEIKQHVSNFMKNLASFSS
jgi:hypothetical protein